MKIIMKDRIAQALEEDLNEIHVERSRDYQGKYDNESSEIDLSTLTKNEIERLAEVFETSGITGTKILAADVRKYLRAAKEGVDAMHARTIRQAAWMLEHYFVGLPNHTIFSEDRYGGRSHSGYFVSDVTYHPEVKGDSRRNSSPEHCEIELVHVENDVREHTDLFLESGDCLEMTPKEILRKSGYVPETPELIGKLRKETERYYLVREQVGRQFLATGIGVADLDDAAERTFLLTSWDNRFRLDHFGQETRVIVDVLRETEREKEDYHHDARVDPYRWHEFNLRFFTPAEDAVARHLIADEDTFERPIVEIPVHPLVPCFDLRRHARIRVHVNNLTEYVYRKEVSKNLVLPDRDWQMIDLLVDQSHNTFQDVVAGKGQSMNILAEGPPGTGKTVTAEVFAEFKERPLYTIQCSQLGLDPKEVESNLRVILNRANRWNAILLLDEADVYVRHRGDDVQQNAIVGAFLRVLEYASCILFMTTNRPEDVDDAIASRCIARLRYEAPTPENQARLWRILADLNGLEFAAAEIQKVVEAHPTLTGRDVKNLLKLASFIAASKKQTLDAKMIEYALQFKPTEGGK